MTAQAPPPDRTSLVQRAVQLQHRLSELEAASDAPVAAGALEQARKALQEARAPGVGIAAADRAQGIAEAALALADLQMARQRAQQALLDAEARLVAVRDRAAAQRRVLETLMHERASLARAAESAP